MWARQASSTTDISITRHRGQLLQQCSKSHSKQLCGLTALHQCYSLQAVADSYSTAAAVASAGQWFCLMPEAMQFLQLPFQVVLLSGPTRLGLVVFCQHSAIQVFYHLVKYSGLTGQAARGLQMRLLLLSAVLLLLLLLLLCCLMFGDRSVWKQCEPWLQNHTTAAATAALMCSCCCCRRRW
jgi:hypothetical protein